MYTINGYEWAFVELHFELNGQQKKGHMWWSTKGDVLFKEISDDGVIQWYNVTQHDGGHGIDIVIKAMTKISNSDVVVEVPDYV